MPKYRVSFTTHITLTVDLDAPDQDTAADDAWQPAEDYLKTVFGNFREVRAEATLDGIGAESVEEVQD